MREDCAHGSFLNGLLPVEKTLVLVAVTSLLLVGCGKKSNPPAQTTNAVPTADRIKATPPTTLGRYVAALDTNYQWQVVNTLKQPGMTVYMTRLRCRNTWCREQWRREPTCHADLDYLPTIFPNGPPVM